MIPEDDLDEYLKRLLPGVKFISHPRATGIIWAMSPMIELQIVTDEEVDAYMHRYWEEHPPLLEIPLAETKKKEAFSEEHRRFIMEVINHPYENSTAYYKALSLSASTGNRIKEQLEAMQFIRLHKVPMERKGGIPEAIEILPIAHEKLGLEYKPLPGKGGFLHAWWIGRISRKIHDKKPVIEKVMAGKSADLAIETVIGWLAYEVQLDCKEALLKDLIAKDLVGFQHVTICVPSKRDMERVTKVVGEMQVGSKVKAELLVEFY